MADVEAIIAELNRTASELAMAAEKIQDDLLAALRRSESKMFGRVAEIMAEAPLDEARAKKLAWYGKNLFSTGQIASEFTDEYMGYVDQYLRGYRALEGYIEEAIGLGTMGLPEGVTSIPKELVDALKARQRDHFAFLGQEAMDRLDQVLLDQMLTATSRGSALAAIRGVITGDYPWGKRRGLYEWHAGTYARTAHMQFSRSVQASQAEKYGIKQFIYLGPIDDITRKFCIQHVGKIYSREEIEGMDNGQTGNVFLDGGGWNCRHEFFAAHPDLANAIKESGEMKGDAVAAAQAKGISLPSVGADGIFSSVPEYVEFDAAADALDYGRKMGFTDYYWKSADVQMKVKAYTSADDALEFMNLTNKAAQAFLERYPEFLGKLPRMEIGRGSSAWGRIDGGPKHIRMTMGSNCEPLTEAQRLKVLEWEAKDGYRGNVGLGWTGADDWPRAVFRHELAHNLSTPEIQNLWDEALKESQVFGKWKVWTQANISKYGTKDKLEMIAECFAYYTSPFYGTPTAPKVIPGAMEAVLDLMLKMVDYHTIPPM